MNDTRYPRHLYFSTVAKYVASGFFILAPVLSYFATTTLSYAKDNRSLFLSLSTISSLGNLAIGLLINYVTMRPVLSCISKMAAGATVGQSEMRVALRSAYRFPIIHSLTIFLLWAVITDCAIILPFVLTSGMTPLDIWVTIGLDVITGMGSVPLYYLIGDAARSKFVGLPQVAQYQADTRRQNRAGLSRKILLIFLTVVLYPTGILTLLVVLSNAGQLNLKDAYVGILLLILATLAMAVISSLLTARGVARPLAEAAEATRKVLSGDLDASVAARSEDEVGILARALNAMTQGLRTMVSGIDNSAAEVAVSSGQLASTAQSLAEGAQSQASTLEQTAASVEELSASVEQVSVHAQSQAGAVKQGVERMKELEKYVEEVRQSLVGISALSESSAENAVEGYDSVKEVIDSIGLIAESSQKIAGIVTVIGEIADQTNLLALNAAIEAARAGEHGRGFAVVADAVGNLAERSATSAKEVATLIEESVRNVNNGVATASRSQGAMDKIRTASQEAKDKVAGLVEAVRHQESASADMARALSRLSDLSGNISTATEEQSTSARQVSKAVENVSELTQAAAAAAEEMSQATVQLSGMADNLKSMIGQFKTNGNGRAVDAEL